jgi:ubiquinone/menaquinone biosynthesis C-methylase UbiE
MRMGTSLRPAPDSVLGSYDRWSESYDSDHNLTRDFDARILRDKGLEIRGKDVLELGCGTGKNTEWLVLHARHVLGLDLSPRMLDKARQRLADVRHVSFVQHDITEPWPVPEGSRDCVTSNLVLEHVRQLRPILAQVARVLRPAGTYFQSELHPFRQLQGSQAQFIRTDTQQPEFVTAYQHDVSDYVGAGLAAGLVLKELEEWRDPEADALTLPRLLSLTWQKPT